MRAFRLPRRPILTMSPSRTGQVGSPTRQKSGHLLRVAAIHSSTRTVPSVAGPSSSPVISRLIEPVRRPALQMRAAAATKAAMRALHVAGAAAVQHAVRDLAAERVVPPVRRRPAPHRYGRQSRNAAAGRRCGRTDCRSSPIAQPGHA